ncbi:hypothetical protein NC99_14650 [Sunxiuqinia dokdonensis]|uniref:Uncharacterized protein n=1 Tax=Sunxiuqinia dokdonensis TaxID=1409788 RepID=A0A0L8VC40_9BACT|nr:hypothetical protein NC99_14650 [Sunxiuqinia dokdonensis]
MFQLKSFRKTKQEQLANRSAVLVWYRLVKTGSTGFTS